MCCRPFDIVNGCNNAAGMPLVLADTPHWPAPGCLNPQEYILGFIIISMS
jgi:hypothetical protein